MKTIDLKTWEEENNLTKEKKKYFKKLEKIAINRRPKSLEDIKSTINYIRAKIDWEIKNGILKIIDRRKIEYNIFK